MSAVRWLLAVLGSLLLVAVEPFQRDHEVEPILLFRRRVPRKAILVLFLAVHLLIHATVLYNLDREYPGHVSNLFRNELWLILYGLLMPQGLLYSAVPTLLIWAAVEYVINQPAEAHLSWSTRTLYVGRINADSFRELLFEGMSRYNESKPSARVDHAIWEAYQLVGAIVSLDKKRGDAARSDLEVVIRKVWGQVLSKKFGGDPDGRVTPKVEERFQIDLNGDGVIGELIS